MHRRVFFPASLLGLLLVLPVPARAAVEPAINYKKPGVVLRFASLDQLRGDVRYLAEVVGQAEKAKQLDQLIKSKLGEKGFEGVDTKKPLGLYGWIGALGIDSQIVFLVPVSDEKAFLDLLSDQLDVKPDKGADGVYTLNVEKAIAPAYVRFANKYAYLTVRDKDLLDKDKLLAPEKVLPANQRDVLSATVDIDQIPNKLKELGLGVIENHLADLKERDLPNHTEAQKKFRDAAVDEMSAAIKSLLNDGGQATLRLHLDRTGGDLSLTASVAGKAGSALAADIEKLGQAKSYTAALLRSDSALKGELNVHLPQKLRGMLAPALKDAEKQALARANEGQRELLTTILEGIRPTLKAAELDTAIDLRGPNDKGAYTVMAGVKIKEGAKMEKSFRKSASHFPDLIKLDVEKVDQASIHRINPPKELKPGARRTLGDNPMYVAFRENVMLIGAGDKGLAALKEALTAAPTTGKVVEVQMALGRLVPLFNDPTHTDIARDVFGKAKDGDRFHLTVEGGKALTVRLAIKAKLIDFLNRVEKEKKQ
jgi:hypothetical protein